MRDAEIAGLEGVGGMFSGLIRLWKSVEKLKAPALRTRVGHLRLTAKIA